MASATDNLETPKIDDGDINILLLGESGVGKSTFINSMVNYLQHETLENALQKELTCLIPSKFSISDENYETQEVHIGSDENEDANIGNSSTQGARSYVFHINKNSKCRIIDTPGIGDARGLDKDAENFDNILTYISQYKYLHGICFLLKPNVTVISAYFKLCLINLLSRLDKSASRNIIFIFTNSRGTFYRPGETLTLLRRILSEIEEAPPHVKVPCHKENIFCVDNEAFKFVAAMKQGVTFGHKEKAEFSKSWATSCTTVKSLLRYVQDEKKIMPHQVQSTLSINEVRQNIMDLIKPLADVTEHIRNNLFLLKRHMEDLSSAKLSNKDLEQRLFVPSVTMQLVQLTQPMTVCTSAKCSKVVSKGGISHRVYDQCCHNPCYLKGIPKEIIGAPELQSCAVFTGTKCTVCYCDVSLHMHIYYKTETRVVEREDLNVQSQMLSKSKLVAKKNVLIEDMMQKSKEFANEQRTILKTMAKFAFFLNENSMTQHNDSYLQYLNCLIEREESLGENVSEDLLNNLKDLKITYQAEMENLNEAKKKGLTQSSKFSISISEVLNCIKNLFKLRWNGKTIEEFYTKQRTLKHQKVSQVEYFHPTFLSDNSGENSIHGNQNVMVGQSSDNLNQSPNKLDENHQGRIDQNSSNSNLNPSDSNLNPDNSNPNPDNSNPNPNNSNQNPDNYNPNPGNSNQNPDKVKQSPGNSNPNPDNSNQNPGTFKQSPSNSNPNPGNSNQNPDNSNANQENSNRNPCKCNENLRSFNQTTGNSNPNTDNSNPNPDNSNPYPKSSNSNPDKSNPYPNNSNPNPDNSNPYPNNLKPNSDNSNPNQDSSNRNPQNINQNHGNFNQNRGFTENPNTTNHIPYTKYSQHPNSTNQNHDYFGPNSLEENCERMEVDDDNANYIPPNIINPSDSNQNLGDLTQTPGMFNANPGRYGWNAANFNQNTDLAQVEGNSTSCNKKENPHPSHLNTPNEKPLENKEEKFMLFEQYWKFKQFRKQGNAGKLELNPKKLLQSPTYIEPNHGDVKRNINLYNQKDQENKCNFTQHEDPINSAKIRTSSINRFKEDPSTAKKIQENSPQMYSNTLNETEEFFELYEEYEKYYKRKNN